MYNFENIMSQKSKYYTDIVNRASEGGD
jgi:hypothetical protein